MLSEMPREGSWTWPPPNVTDDGGQLYPNWPRNGDCGWDSCWHARRGGSRMPSHTRKRPMRTSRTLLGLVVLLGTSPRATGDDLREIDPNEATGSSLAVVVSDVPLAHTAQIFPVDARGAVVGKDAGEQCGKLLDELGTVLADVASGFDRLVKLNFYVARPEDVSAIE